MVGELVSHGRFLSEKNHKKGQKFTYTALSLKNSLDILHINMYARCMKWQAMIATMMQESEKYGGGVTSRWQLREKLGWNSPTGVYHALQSKKVTLQLFYKMCQAFDYEILVIPRNPRRSAFKVGDDT